MSTPDPWRPWIYDPPSLREWEVIEWRRDTDPPEMEPRVANLFILSTPSYAHWNVAGVYWRPVL